MNIQPDQLIIEDKHTALRIIALIMIALGLILFWSIGLSPLLIFIVVGLIFLVVTSDLTITADHPSQMLWLEYRSLFKHTRIEIPFAEIASIGIEHSTIVRKHRKRPVYRIVVTLRDGQVVPFRSTFQGGPLSEKEQQVNALRDFIDLGWPL